MTMQTHKFKVISLDVWGHGPEHEKYDCDGNCDGWTVNDAHYTGRTIEVEACEQVYNADTPHEFREFGASHEAIINACIEAGMLTSACAEKNAITFDGEDDHTLYLEDAETGRPLIQLERVL